MDLRSLYYFVTVAEERNITRAAERLNMSQPPLSAQIKGLEEELGIQLFIRGKRQLTITDAGVLLLRRAKQILELAAQTQHELKSMEGLSGNLNISLVEGRAPYLLARWIAGFRAEFPKVTVHLWNGSGDDVLERLNRGLADLALVAAPYNAELMEGITVGREPWVAILSRQHPLAQEEGDFLPLRKLVGQPLFIPSRQSRAEAVRTWFEELGEEPLIAGDLYHRERQTDRVCPGLEQERASVRPRAGVHQLRPRLPGGRAAGDPDLPRAGARISPAGGYPVLIIAFPYHGTKQNRIFQGNGTVLFSSYQGPLYIRFFRGAPIFFDGRREQCVV